ncbi:MAG: cytochrome c oxidase subunit II [Rhodobacteraceae bacterium]|nr:cytochrome c oxidase subunit II [Paracoccaceae bacterium]
MRMNGLFKGFISVAAGMMAAGAAMAEEGLEGLDAIGKPTAGAMGFQRAATELARDAQWLDGMVLWIITIITIFVTGLLIWVIIRYNHKANKEPARFTHHTMIEIAWTVVPIIILIFIGSFSLPILFKQLEIPESDLTVKVTGNQWYWTYEYPENGVSFDSFMLGRGKPGLTEEVKAELAAYGYAEDEYLLAADTAMVVPVGAVVRVMIAASDVNHSFAVPAFGIKMDAIVGRLNETWFRVGADPRDIAAGTDSDEDYIGTYFGQCSELCGKDHSFMPIVIKVVSQETYDAWMAGAIEKYAGVPVSVQVASN